MFGYYLQLAWRSCLKTWGLTLLMVLAIALGIGASMTTITINYLMSADPIPAKSQQLFYVQLDNWDPAQPFNADGDPPSMLTYRDAYQLWQAQQARRQAMMAATAAVIEPATQESQGAVPFMATGRATNRDFFALFDVPFLYGHGWDLQADQQQAQVVVISQQLSERLFGGQDPTGQVLRVGRQQLRIIGVLAHWQPSPRFYDLSQGNFIRSEDFYLPFSLLTDGTLQPAGGSFCWQEAAAGIAGLLASECGWTQLWVELPDAAAREQYLQWMQAYVDEQRRLGRFARPDNQRLLDVMSWLDEMQVVLDDAPVLLTLSLLFFAVCLLNTVGLMSAKFLSKSAEIGIRQALGASRRDLFYQHLVETALVGLLGGLGGLVLAWLGLQAVQALYGDWMQQLTRLNVPLVALAIALAVSASVVAGLYPTWRACQVQPSHQLKAQ